MVGAKLRQIIINHLRRIGYRNIHRNAAFKEAHLGRGQWKCKQCGNIYPNRGDLHGDHIEPVIYPQSGFVDWNTYIERLFCGQIQAICITCHKAKTKAENAVRWEEI